MMVAQLIERLERLPPGIPVRLYSDVTEGFDREIVEVECCAASETVVARLVADDERDTSS